MTLDAGNTKYAEGGTVTLDSDTNTVENGDAVTFDDSGYLTRATDTDFVIGTVLPEEQRSDSMRSVHVGGMCHVVEVTGGASVGDFLKGNSGGDGAYQTFSPATPSEASNPFVIEAEDEGNNLYVAVFR